MFGALPSNRRANTVHRSFVGRPSLCEGLRFLRMTAGGGNGQRWSTFVGREERPTGMTVSQQINWRWWRPEVSLGEAGSGFVLPT
jgi:hypothetical protein